jgi:hypothetical protein
VRHASPPPEIPHPCRLPVHRPSCPGASPTRPS